MQVPNRPTAGHSSVRAPLPNAGANGTLIAAMRTSAESGGKAAASSDSRQMKPGPRIVIADDHPLVARGLRALLARSCDVLTVVCDPRELMAVLKLHKPQLLLLDLSMPHLNGLEVLALVRKKFPTLRVLVVTMHLDRAFAELAFEKGAHGFIPKSAPPEELRSAIASVMEGERYLSPNVPRRGYRETGSIGDAALDRLTPRQQEILNLLGEAKTSAEIAAELHLTTRTVAFHRAQIRRVLGIRSELGLVEYAVTARLSQNSVHN